MPAEEAVGEIIRKFGGATAALALEDGTVIWGRGFGAAGRKVGEVVFTTAMNGYTESMTDPSYRGQILVITHPLVGNYGVPPDFESGRIQVEGLVISALSEPSHPRSTKSLHDWMLEWGVPGIERVDTRMLVKRIREGGVMVGALQVVEEGEAIRPQELVEVARGFDYESMELEGPSMAADGPVEVGRRQGDPVAVVDLGLKGGIAREIAARGMRAVVVPGNWSADDVLSLRPRGVVIGNGPGNPAAMEGPMELTEGLLGAGIPVLGICLGHQLVASAMGARIYKMKYGHRGINKPVRDLRSGRLAITTHNHGYAVDRGSLDGTGLRPWFVDLDDGTVEGLYHESKPVMTVQFHPEGSPGPRDAAYVFDAFKGLVERGGAI